MEGVVDRLQYNSR
jgi:hypothetical protein